MWMLSTKMMPPVGVLVPMYLLFRDTGLLDTRTGLTGLMTLVNLPIVVWMLFTYFKEIPTDILEAARMDGAPLRKEIIYVLAPMAVPGIASTLLLTVILAWNEAFWTLNLSAAKAAPLTRLHRLLFQPRGPVLGQAVRRFDARHRADPGARLVLAEAAGPRPDLRRREMNSRSGGAPMGSITLDHVAKRFGEHAVIPDINLDIADGEFVVFVGPSGCGKSTLLRLIAGLEDTSGGKHRDRRRGRHRAAAGASAGSRWCSSPTRSTRI